MYTAEDLKTEVYNLNSKLSFAEWDQKIYGRGLWHKKDTQLEDARIALLGFVNQLQEGVDKGELKEDADHATIVTRVKDKYASVCREIEYRAAALVSREIIGTTYYIDLDGGNDGAAGTAIGTAWLTIEQYTTTTVRSAGDIAKVRANTDELPAGNISCDESGTRTAFIQIKGCDSVDDPWSDGSDVKPIIDFGGNARRLHGAYRRAFWKFEQLDFQDSTSTYGALDTGYFRGTIIDTCNFQDGDIGLMCGNSITVIDCTFSDHADYCVTVRAGGGKFFNCTFDGTGSYGMFSYSIMNSPIYLVDCEFGGSTAFNSGDIYCNDNDNYFCRNVTLNSTNEVVFDTGYSGAVQGGVFIEDYGGTKGAHKCYFTAGTVTKDTGVTRSGGAPSSAKMEPDSPVCADFPLTIMNDNAREGDFKIWCPAGANTISVWIRSIDAWSAYPTNSELYIVAEYWDGATAVRVDSTQSTQVLSHASNWVEFTTTFTLNTEGFVYLKVVLNKYEANKGVYVDILPVLA